MRLLFYRMPGQGKPVTDSNGLQEVIGALIDDGDMIVAVLDKYVNRLYIERVTNKFDQDVFRSQNFSVIHNNESWNSYYSFFAKAESLQMKEDARQTISTK